MLSIFSNINCNGQIKLISDNIEDSTLCYKTYPWLTEPEIYGLFPPEKTVEPLEPLDSVINNIKKIFYDNKTPTKKLYLTLIIDSLGKCRGLIIEENINNKVGHKILDSFRKIHFAPAEYRNKKINNYLTMCIKL